MSYCCRASRDYVFAIFCLRNESSELEFEKNRLSKDVIILSSGNKNDGVLMSNFFMRACQKTWRSTWRFGTFTRVFKKARSKHNSAAAAIGNIFVLNPLDPLFQEFYPEGHYIIKQNTLGDKFYILSEGRVKVTKINKGTDEWIIPLYNRTRNTYWTEIDVVFNTRFQVAHSIIERWAEQR